MHERYLAAEQWLYCGDAYRPRLARYVKGYPAAQQALRRSPGWHIEDDAVAVVLLAARPEDGRRTVAE